MILDYCGAVIPVASRYNVVVALYLLAVTAKDVVGDGAVAVC